jgi:hypothetical protein
VASVVEKRVAQEMERLDSVGHVGQLQQRHEQCDRLFTVDGLEQSGRWRDAVAGLRR